MGETRVSERVTIDGALRASLVALFRYTHRSFPNRKTKKRDRDTIFQKTTNRSTLGPRQAATRPPARTMASPPRSSAACARDPRTRSAAKTPRAGASTRRPRTPGAPTRGNDLKKSPVKKEKATFAIYKVFGRRGEEVPRRAASTTRRAPQGTLRTLPRSLVRTREKREPELRLVKALSLSLSLFLSLWSVCCFCLLGNGDSVWSRICTPALVNLGLPPPRGSIVCCFLRKYRESRVRFGESLLEEPRGVSESDPGPVSFSKFLAGTGPNRLNADCGWRSSFLAQAS